MHKLILLIPLIFLTIVSSVTALQYRNICSNNQTLNKFMNFTACETGNCTIYNFSQDVQCEFGCDNVTNSCRQSTITEYGYYFGFIVCLVIIAGIILKLYGGK